MSKGGCLWMSKSGGVFQIDDVTRTMSKGGGGAPGVPPIQVQTPPPTWLAGYGPAKRTLVTIWYAGPYLVYSPPYPDCSCSVHYLCRNIWNTHVQTAKLHIFIKLDWSMKLWNQEEISTYIHWCAQSFCKYRDDRECGGWKLGTVWSRLGTVRHIR